MIKSFVLATVTLVGALSGASAHAGVHWSVGINVPVVGAVVSGGPGYGYGYDEPSYYEPGYYEPSYAPVYAPPPVYRVRPQVGYYPPQVIYRPVPVAYPRYYTNQPPRWKHGHGHGRWEGRDHYDRWDDRGRR